MERIYAAVIFEDIVEYFSFNNKLEAIESMEEFQEKEPQMRYIIYWGLGSVDIDRINRP